MRYNQLVMPEDALCSTQLCLNKPPKTNMHRIKTPGIGTKKTQVRLQTDLVKPTEKSLGHFLLARGRNARYAREYNLASYDDKAGSGMLHGSAVGNTSRTGRASSPAADVCGKIPASKFEGKKIADCCE